MYEGRCQRQDDVNEGCGCPMVVKEEGKVQEAGQVYGDRGGQGQGQGRVG